MGGRGGGGGWGAGGCGAQVGGLEVGGAQVGGRGPGAGGAIQGLTKKKVHPEGVATSSFKYRATLPIALPEPTVPSQCAQLMNVFNMVSKNPSVHISQ